MVVFGVLEHLGLMENFVELQKGFLLGLDLEIIRNNWSFWFFIPP